MHLDFTISHEGMNEFLAYWESKYRYSDEENYTQNIGKPLSDESIAALFKWKNGMDLSAKKANSVKKNYPSQIPIEPDKVYLNSRHAGGAVWNIFFLHCIDQRWPIFDQHTYRAMSYIRNRKTSELPFSKAKIFELYKNEYVHFVSELGVGNLRQKDKALFAFGQFLKLASPYT